MKATSLALVTRLVLVLVGVSLFCGSATAQTQTAGDIVAASIAASGGAEAIAKIRNFTSTGRMTIESPIFAKLEGTIEAVRVPGRKYFESVKLGPISVQKGWDGERSWEQGPAGLRMLEGSEATALVMQSFANPLVALQQKAPGLRIERLADADVNGRPHYVLAVTSDGAPPSKAYIDRETRLLTRNTSTMTVPNVGEVPVVVDAAGYESFEGVKIAATVTIAVEGVSTTKLMLDRIVVNTAINESSFAVPSGSAAPAAPSPAPRARDNACPAGTLADVPSAPRWNGWGAGPGQHRFQPAAMAGLSAADVPRLKLKWAFGFPEAAQAFAQPAVAGGRVFVGSANGTVYALNTETGCQYWAFKADAGVRTAVSVGRAASDRGRWLAYFGDRAANIYAVDAETGALVWKRGVGDHKAAIVTGAPTLADGTLYVGTSSSEEVLGANGHYECCTFRGSVSALNAATGQVRWQSHVIAEEPRPVRKNTLGVQLWGPSGAGIWSAPTVDVERGAVYVTTGDSYSDPAAATSDAFVAFDLRTGTLLWSRQATAGDAFTVDCDFPKEGRTNCPDANGPDHDFGSSAMLVRLRNGGRALIAGQKSGVVHAVDPDRGGAIRWQKAVGKGSRLGGIQWGTAYDGSRIYVAVSDIFTPPPMQPNPEAGGLFALDPETGAILWHTPHPGCGGRPGCSPAQSAAVTAIPGVVFSGGLDGHLRAYAARDGAIVWDVDTAREYDSVNGVPAHGGSLDGPGPVVAGGTLFVNSGYAFIAGRPGNVLLAFAVDGTAR